MNEWRCCDIYITLSWRLAKLGLNYIKQDLKPRHRNAMHTNPQSIPPSTLFALIQNGICLLAIAAIGNEHLTKPDWAPHTVHHNRLTNRGGFGSFLIEFCHSSSSSVRLRTSLALKSGHSSALAWRKQQPGGVGADQQQPTQVSLHSCWAVTQGRTGRMKSRSQHSGRLRGTLVHTAER